LFSDDAFGHTGFTGTSIWIDPTIDLYIILLTNRTYEMTNRSLIKEFRPLIHDYIIECINKN
jgi:CubicO group peptidase (beta-lactamase class C family)